MYVPVMTTCGHNYCYDCISNWLVSNNANELTCPQCRSPLKEQPSLNSALQNLLEFVFDRFAKDNSKASFVRTESISQYKDDQDSGELYKNVFNNTAVAVVDDDDGVVRCSNCHWEVEGDVCPHCSARMRNRGPEEDGLPSDEYSAGELEEMRSHSNRELSARSRFADLDASSDEDESSSASSTRSGTETPHSAFVSVSRNSDYNQEREGSQLDSEEADSDLDSFIVNEDEEREQDLSSLSSQDNKRPIEENSSDRDSDFYEHNDDGGFVSGDSLDNDEEETDRKSRKRRFQVVIDSDEED